MSQSADIVSPQLDGVPETLLWTLYQRSLEAERADGVLVDPLAVELVRRIDYPFAERFGGRGLGQLQALRARCFDREVERFLAVHPDGAVVALGEGLETQFWRVDNGRVRWLSVDLPEAVALRARLLPAAPRLAQLACSALDERWMDAVDGSRGLLITAQGLLMYLPRVEVDALIAGCARCRRRADAERCTAPCCRCSPAFRRCVGACCRSSPSGSPPAAAPRRPSLGPGGR